MQKSGTKLLETDRLILRRITINDSETIFRKWASDEAVAKYMIWSKHKTIEDTKKWIKTVEQTYKENLGYEWGIVLKKTNELIGSIGAYPKAEFDNRYEIGYCLAKKYWGNGYVTESAKCVKDYLVNQEGIKQFVGRHAKLNGASGAVIQKLGFRYIKDGWYRKYDGTMIFDTRIYYYDVYENIEKAKPEDAMEMAKLVISSWRETYKGLMDENYLANLDENQSQEKWKQQIINNENILVYRENESILGVIKYGRAENREDAGEVYVLYVKPEEKRKGIGSKLLNTAKQELLQCGYKQMIIWCLDGNTIGQNFYKKSGGIQKEHRVYTVNGIEVEENEFWYNFRIQNLEDIILVFPSKDYEEQAICYKKEHFENNEKKIHACSLWDKMDSYDEWLKQIQNNSKKETVSKDWTVSSTFFGVRSNDNKIVGMIDIRHELNSDFLRNYAGNIGYGVRPSERKKGYATKMLASALDYCKNELKLDKVMINCYKANEASRKTIINAGGILEREYENDGNIIQLYWVKI